MYSKSNFDLKKKKRYGGRTSNNYQKSLVNFNIQQIKFHRKLHWVIFMWFLLYVFVEVIGSQCVTILLTETTLNV